jgi:diaminopimelate decarboxylase
MIKINELEYREGVLHLEQVDLVSLAHRFGTPCYAYSRHHIEQNYREYDQAFGSHPHQICYAVKANSNLAVLNLLARLGSGFDIVSGGELSRVIAAGGDPGKTVFSGVAKSEREIRFALEKGIGCLNLESEAELERVVQVAEEMGVVAPVSFRVNPDVDPQTHPYISTGLKKNKFGVPIDSARQLYQRASSFQCLKILGIDCHIGSQLTKLSPFVDTLERLLALLDDLKQDGIQIDHLDLGGGLGIVYQESDIVPSKEELVGELIRGLKGRHIKLLIEPGRSIIGNSAVLLTQVEYLKAGEENQFAIVDAAMNDLVRPALYDAWMQIVPVNDASEGSTFGLYDVVGPICETGDFLGKGRQLAIKQGDFLAVLSAGAYGFTMSSNYNSRPRAAEVLVDGNRMELIRQRETVESLYANEIIPG